ncbi:MAG: hypothetical protein JNL28_11530 [Planctomycetes bacterium]|nr:hypothetical protein [Planctomycetota bacterium]
MDKNKQASTANAAARTKDQKQTATTKTATGGHPFVAFMGIAAIASGCALILLPVIARDLSWITNSFAKNGISGAAVALTGLILVVLANMNKQRIDPALSQRSEEQALLLEQLASDLALTRGGMQELRIEFVYLKDQVATAVAQRELLDSQSDGDDAQAGMFRLAASMDQLTGRLEVRMKTQDAALNEQLGLLREELAQTVANVAGLRACIEDGLNESDQARSTGAESDSYDLSDERQIEIAEGYEPHEDDLEVTVELDESPEEELELGLGLLDEMDDQGHPHPAKQSLSMRPSRRSTDLDALAGLLPSRNGTAGMDVDEKLAALRELMSDPSVREALEAARNR